MDMFDLKILDALQQDGRLTSQELATKVGLSASQCARRRALLEQSGVISGYHARLSRAAVGLELIVFMEITLDSHSVGAADRLLALMQAMPEVTEAYSMTGSTDYHVKLVVPDLKTLSHVINNKLLPHEGVSHLKSSIVLDRLKETGTLSLSHLCKA
ncbi:Lrp/AsnC family transcriptional regulator [Cohaesibacter celericrescens]|uniref:AsnC family transcriptional regulator n=1 Tax=Cohaesibacter celericrescens TaxID=2067669 RepID=A0A2N5XNA7_9HYPH|nr:Lrp/AsnC family transcriptional regulator [Cohaesibacter celericrescens]PLW75955.1 AsnC family transcriptional regulator [Cohaesibacter celericrescens]